MLYLVVWTFGCCGASMFRASVQLIGCKIFLWLFYGYLRMVVVMSYQDQSA